MNSTYSLSPKVILVLILLLILILCLPDHLFMHNVLLLLSQLLSLNFILVLILPQVLLSCLSFLHLLLLHPFWITPSLPLVYHLICLFLPLLKVSKVCNFSRLLNLFLHEPIVHKLCVIFIFQTLRFSNRQKFFFDFVLSLMDQLSFKSLLGILRLQPIFVWETVTTMSS